MPTPLVHVTFTDGRSETAPLNPRIMVEVERKFGEIPPIEGSLYGAWLRLGRHGSFEEWLDSVESMEQELGTAGPTQQEASADS